MGSRQAKLSYAVAVAVKEIVRSSRLPSFVTFTFKENVTEKEEAGKRFRRLKARLKRAYEGLRAVGVWQRQGRGAWHIHLIVDRRLEISQVREMALACGFGPQIRADFVGTLKGMKAGWTPERVSRYLVRYITRDEREERDKGVRLVEYIGDARKATVSFGWADGFARLWREGREAWHVLFGVDRPPLDAYWFVVRLGWESLNEKDQLELLNKSDSVKIWFDPESYPF